MQIEDVLLHQITARLSLRPPQAESLRSLTKVLGLLELTKDLDPDEALAAIQEVYPSVTDFERDFPSLCYALATGVGKTRLMGAFIAYLYLSRRSKNFFVLAPNLTIYEKLIADFTPGTPKYVFKGIAEFARTPPQVVTGETYQDGRGLRLQGSLLDADCVINVFNVSKINADTRGGKAPRIKRLMETLGESYFNYLAGLDDLVLLMDEAHRYRASRAMEVINELNPILGLEVTATPLGFKNVIYRYGLAEAMTDGFVKEPAVATREDFNPSRYTQAELERIKLEDGVHHHEFVKVRLELYARKTGRKPVHPFMLVVAQNIEHAKELRQTIEADTFFEGRYKGRVIEVHSGQGAAEREKSEKQLLALETDRSTEIVIHVNKLNEGWDVTNLYTIVPLRAFAAEILTEQTLGRGLRLPYGERTGDETVDRLTVIAHEHFDEIIKAAKQPGSIVMKELKIGDSGDVPTKAEVIVEAKPTYEQKIFEGPAALSEEQRPYVELVQQVIEGEERRLKGGLAQLSTPEVQKRIEDRVTEILKPVQGSLGGIEKMPDVKAIVAKVVTSIVEHSIEIPEIWIRPEANEVNFRYRDFDLAGLDSIGIRPVDGNIVVEDVRTGNRQTIRLDEGGKKEARLEDYLVRRLMDYDEIDYDQHNELLYELARQMVEHLRGYLSDEQVEAVLKAQAKMLAEFIFEQMQRDENVVVTATKYKPEISRSFKRLKPQPYGKERQIEVRSYWHPVEPLRDTRKYLFNGFARCGYDTQRFHSDDERRFAVLLESERAPKVKVWIKPATGQFEIHYARGSAYEPDFLVETKDEMLICEVKARTELDDATVKAKAAAAREWVKAANTVAAESGRKPWRYALIPHDEVNGSATLDGLMARFGQV